MYSCCSVVFRRRKRLFPEITQIICYKDEKHIAFTFETGYESSVYRFLDHLEVTTLNEKQRDFTVDAQVTPVDIVASHIYRKFGCKSIDSATIKKFSGYYGNEEIRKSVHLNLF